MAPRSGRSSHVTTDIRKALSSSWDFSTCTDSPMPPTQPRRSQISATFLMVPIRNPPSLVPDGIEL